MATTDPNQRRRRRKPGTSGPPSVGSSTGSSDTSHEHQHTHGTAGTSSIDKRSMASSISGHTYPHDEDTTSSSDGDVSGRILHADKKRPMGSRGCMVGTASRSSRSTCSEDRVVRLISGFGNSDPKSSKGRAMSVDRSTAAATNEDDVEMADREASSNSSEACGVRQGADDPDTDDGYAVGIDLEGGDDSGYDCDRKADAMAADTGTAETTATGAGIATDETAMDADTNSSESKSECHKALGIDRQTKVIGQRDMAIPNASTSTTDPPVNTKSHGGRSSSSSDQASIGSASGRRRLRRELEAVEKERNNEQASLPSLPKSPEPPEPYFPPEQLEENLLQSPRKDSILRSLSETLVRGSLTSINLSQRGLTEKDANVIQLALIRNPNLSTLKLSYNSLGDEGAAIIASGIGQQAITAAIESAGLAGVPLQQARQQQVCTHHASLSVLDLGFNGITDVGCASLSTVALAGNAKLQTLYLAGNNISGPGAMALAAAIAKGGCGLTNLHLSANRIGTLGTRGIAIAIAESEAKRQQIAAAKSMAAEAATAAGEHALMNMSFPDIHTVHELHLGGANLGSTGCLAISNMALTNQSLRVLSLSSNGISDRDVALFSQSISRNKAIPLEKIQFSFNRLTCVGVESLMNAIWGSTTLKEVRLDNNQIKDRGAQLAAVTLTSMSMEILDLGFNKITTVGIKAIMKSLSEDTSLRTLVLSGNPLDINASKAISYALAYNRTLQEFNVDNCAVGYAAQRHIAAGVVSNSGLTLKTITGFRLGSIAVTLGLPPALDKWSNEQTLKFIRMMWQQRRDGERDKMDGDETDDDCSITYVSASDDSKGKSISASGKNGPADPAVVVSAAKSAFEAMGDSKEAVLMSDVPPRERADSCPLVIHDAVMLERSPSGTIRVPIVDETDGRRPSNEVTPMRRIMDEKSSSSPKKGCFAVDPVRHKRLEEWLGQHFTSLTQLANLPFNDADLWKLHQYFFSPVGTSIFKKSTDGPQIASQKTEESAAVKAPKTPGGLTRKTSFRHLGDAAAPSDLAVGSSSSLASQSNRRRSLEMLDQDGSSNDAYPATKRARSNKPRIDFYPRVRTMLENLRYQTNQNQALIKLRQLKYVEGSMFQGRNVQAADPDLDGDSFNTTDVEAILDML